MTRGSVISDGGRGEFSRGSTQSVFSGLEGSFPSGSISDLRGFGSGLARFEAGSANENRGTQLAQLAHVNVDDLSDDGLANVIDELKAAVRRFALETIMFEGYYTRMIHGGQDLPKEDSKPGSLMGSRKGSTTSSVGTDTESQLPSSISESQTQTADSRRRKRRSGSRTSLGSRGKSLKLTTDKKSAIAVKEIERYEQALANFRGSANVSRKDGLAETEERALKLGEIEKTRETFQKGLLTTITYVDGKKMRDRARVGKILDDELLNHFRNGAKLKTKNGVIITQRNKLMQQIKMHLAESEISGPVDLAQLQLENAELLEILQSKNRKVIEERDVISSTRRKKNRKRQKLESEEERWEKLNKQKIDQNRLVPRLTKNIDDLKRKMEKQKERNKNYQRLLEQERVEEIPTLDNYIGLKLSLEQLEWRNKVLERQKNIESLKKQNERAKREKEKREVFAMGIGYHQKGSRPSPNMDSQRRREKIDLNMPSTTFGVSKIGISAPHESDKRINGQRAKSAGSLKLKTNQGNLFRGPTFDLVYTVPSIASPLPRSGNPHRHDFLDL